ncbi:MAG: CPBP family intramembrane metalloprotease [candidate division Zixibacteria bacterium]|nr:CPBP family intramembrane metalloprotease [candidate division Zixibacteria bacterium]
MENQTPQKIKLSLKEICLAWFGLIFSSLVIGIIAASALGPPEPVVLKWGIGDFSIFAISLYCIGSLIAVGVLYLLLKERGLNLKDIGLKGKLSLPSLGYALIAVIVAFILYPSIEALLKTMSVSMFWRPEKVTPLKLISVFDFLLVLLFAVILGPIVEEIIFRGYIFTAFLQRMKKPIFAFFLSALIFTSVHIFLGPGVMVFIFFWSFIPAYLYLKFNSLYPAILFHMVNNFIAYIVFPLFFYR